MCAGLAPVARLSTVLFSSRKKKTGNNCTRDKFFFGRVIPSNTGSALCTSARHIKKKKRKYRRESSDVGFPPHRQRVSTNLLTPPQGFSCVQYLYTFSPFFSFLFVFVFIEKASVKKTRFNLPVTHITRRIGIPSQKQLMHNFYSFGAPPFFCFCLW